MNAKEKALKYLSEYDERFGPHYRAIDPLIKPLCDLLTKNGYITMHSCSAHVEVVSRRTYTVFIDGKIETIDKGYWSHHKQNQWYVLFVATKSISEIKKVINKINKKYDYGLRYEKCKTIDGITRRWMIETHLLHNYTNKDIYELNKNIYLEFKNHFEQKEAKCKSCNGTGQVGYAVDITDYVECPDCDGLGTNWKEKEID